MEGWPIFLRSVNECTNFCTNYLRNLLQKVKYFHAEILPQREDECLKWPFKWYKGYFLGI